MYIINWSVTFLQTELELLYISLSPPSISLPAQLWPRTMVADRNPGLHISRLSGSCPARVCRGASAGTRGFEPCPGFGTRNSWHALRDAGLPRFGVEQRAQLASKSKTYPHVLAMTATPIPRTLALAVHGDMALCSINEMPPGRMPVQTTVVFEQKEGEETARGEEEEASSFTRDEVRTPQYLLARKLNFPPAFWVSESLSAFSFG